MTKYKPLYALYKGLKEHGTDLPDSYGSFERSMTQAGNAGASNRRNFYQSLKDSNYDVPDTYEKFYESMFVPVNNTTSRARKIGETPMTEEDRKGFTLGAQDIRMNASKFAAGDALRYNKLKQRKQKQRKDFGRVKVGTNKTPYAPTDNVVKDEGLNTYVTSDSSDTTNLDYAQQKQAVLDEQNQAYMNAIERGDIPMASETIDKNGLYDLQENIGKDGTEVTEKGIKEQAEARLNVAYQKQKDIMAQLSAAMDGGFSTFEERMQLSATKNKIDEEVRNLEALAGKESSGFWNTLADVANTIPLLHNIKEGINYLFGDDTSKDMYKAIANSMVQSNWDFGVSDIQNSVKLEQIRDKINKGEAVTKEEKEFLDANQKADKSAEWVDQYGSRAYRWTSGAGVSVPYMIDFYITGGLPLMRGMTQAFGRGAMKIAANRGWGKLAHNIMYYTGVAAGDIIGSYAMATTVQGLKTGSDVLNRHLGTLYQDEKGNYAFGTFDENGNLLHEGGESFGKALYKGVTAAMLENYTEKMFGHWHLKSGAFDLLDKNPYTKKLADFFRGVGNKNWYLDTKKFSSKFGIGSYPEEVAEEIVNIPLNAWLVGDNSIKELGDRKTWEDIAGSMAISVGSMAGMASTPHIVRGAANQGIKAYDFAAFYVFKNRLNQANQRASEILGDEWEVIKNRIDSAPNENLGKISADLHKQVSEGKYSEEQLDAAWAYIQNLRVMRGYNLAKTMEMQAKAMTGDENTPADIRQKQLNAAYAAGQETEGENKHLAQVEYEKQKFNLASALGVSDSELENMTDEQISSNLGLDDNLDNVIYNYQNAKALYDGIMDNAQNAVDTATKVAAQRVDAMTNVEDGAIKQALVKGTMGKDDYPVYVISGNIETHDDGIINYSDSDSMIIVYNVATGRKETIPVSMLSAVNPYIQNAEEFKAQAVNEAKEKTITELSNVIDGKLVDGSQFTMEDAQGQIHDYIIEGIDEQGNCIISVDGTILPEPLSLDAIQQQYDQSNVARSVKNDQTAQEPEQTTQEPEQIQQESQPIEDKFDYAKITNENDGKVKRVDVTDEEGKNRFPNAKAVFLIQDKGAMPKFVVMDEEGNLTSYVGKRGDKIHLKGEMTIDEYKKQRQEELQKIAAENANSSMIEDNSGVDRGEIDVEDNTQPLSEADADNVIAQMESSAETAPDLELTPDNWAAEFGEDGIVSTPIGDVKMGENQVAKLFEKGRSKEFGMIKPTLTNPDVIIEVPSHSADGNEERSSSYLFIKTFLGKNGKKVYYFKSVTIKKDGLEISISSHYDRVKRVKEALMKGKLLYRKNDGAQTEQNQPSTSVTTSQEDAAGSSESKDTNISSNGNENNESLTFEDGTPIPVDMNGEVDLSQTDASHAAEWYDNNLGEDADDWLDGEIKKAKKVLEQAKNKKLAGTKPSELVASKKEKEAAIADAQAHYDSAISIRDSLKERRIAKVEDTAEGRKELIEKARRKFARLKSAVKNDAEAVAQIYKETVGTLLHRLYDGTGIDVTDTIPLTAEEYVASNLGAHSLNYEGTETSKGVKQETGLSREDFAKTQLLAADGKGTTIDNLVHSLWENRPSNLDSLDTQDIRNALLSIITSGFKASEARNYIENLRIAQAENILEEQKKAADNAAFAEEQKAKQEEEDKKAEENAEEKAEEKTHSESFNKIVDLAKNLEEILDNPDNVKEIDKITHEIDELLENLSDEEFKEVSDVLLNIDEDLEYLTADEYERREGVEESKKAKAYNESLQQAIKRISPYADALKAAVKSDDKKAIAKARKELTDALLASNLGHGYLSGQLEYAKSAKKKDESYSERRALVKPLTDAIDAIESALDSALAEAGLEGVHVDFTEGGHGWIYADKGSAWSSRLKALDNDYRNVSQYETQNPISVLPQVTIDNVEKVAGIIKSRIEEGERYNSDEYNDEDEQTKFPDKLKEGSETPEVPEDATEENPLGAQRDSAPFSPKDNTKVTNSSEERKAMVKKNAVRSEDVLDHSIGKKMRKSLSRIAKMMGADIIYLHSADSNGWYDEKTNTIYLALDSADVLGTQFVFGHEMTHEIKAKNPAAFEELKNLVKNMMGEDAFNTITDKTQQKYEKGGATYWKDRNAMEEEVVADQIGNWIHDANYAHTLMMKMSHPLLAKLHEIVNRIRFAFTGTEYSDNAKLILRSIEQSYVKTAKGEVTNSEIGEDVSFSLRQKPEPKKKGVGYKVFVLKDGKLYPPMVANPNGAATPVGVWLDADAAPIAGESKTGRPQVKQGGKGTQGGSGKLAYRPGWHLGVVPYAIQFNRKDAEGNKTLFPKNFVFAEVEYAADVDYQEEARQEGINPSGKYQHSLAGLKHLPTDGYYMYRTNPNPETDPWVITGAMKVNRILTRAEQAELVKNAGREPQQIQEGDIVTDDVVNSINQEIADAPKFSLKDNQENPLNQDGTLKLDKIKSVDELTDEDFTSAFRNVELPAIPKNVDAAIGANGKPIVIKKNIFEKNWNAHKFTPAESKKVLNDALYNTDLVGHTQPTKKPNHWVAIKLDDKSPITVLEVNDNKDNVEVVGWYTLDERNLGRIKRQAERNGGELIMLTPKDDKVESLSTPPLSSAAKIDNSSETAKENGEKFSLKDEKIKSVAEKFGVNEDDVAMYANAVEKGSNAEAARARANIKRYLLQANEDKISSFKELMKYTVPVNEVLKENFGDLDAMIEERRKQVEAERNAMEAARKRAQEEEEKRQKHLDELSLIPTDELDKRYMDAISNNDESTAREMLDESARRNGYGDVDSDYQGQGAWAAPSNPQYESDEARRADIENSPDVNLEDIALGYSLQPDDYFDNPRAYMNNTAYGLESAYVIKNALDAIKNGEKDVKVKVYRAVPTSVKEGKLRNGDWVTPSKKYAEMHGDNRLEGKYRIIEDEVPANQLWWDGNDANEFGFDDGKEYRYKNAKNNRKLNDLITYDNKGNVIPPSKRFNSRKNDIRFSLAGERGAAAADKAEERTFRMDNLSVAKDMEKNKKKAKAIKAATGWERGADGKWRYEMPDVVLRDPKEWVNKKTMTLSDIVEKPNDLFKEYPELFDAYPKLKDVKIQKGRAKMGGSYYDNTITLNLGGIREAIKYDLDIHYKIATRLLKRTLVHEVQHYIQHEEGFANGGSEQFVRDAIKDEFEKVIKQIRGLRAEGKEDEAKALAERNKALYNAYANEKDSYKNYKSLSGEVEARNVSARLNMTPEERRKTLAESTEDVARKDQIFLGVGDVSFSLRDMADGKESGAADMAEDLKSLNTPDEVDDAIKTAIEDMPSGWKMANKKMIHIAQALGENRKAEIAGEEPKFSLKDGTLIKAGTYFSGGGLVEEGLKGIIDPVVAVEYDEKISGVYRNNFGQHIVTADVRDVDPKELVKQIDGEVEYFHASPVCKNYSQAKSNHAEVELDKETAASTAEFINAIKPKVVTIENVKGYKDSDAMKTITDALDANGYTWDADVYNAADYGGYTNRERLIVRAVRDGKLPEKPKKMAHKSGWYEAVADIIPTLTEKKNGVAPWMDIRLKADGIDWRNIDKPLYVMGSAYADGKVPHAFADELLPTLRTKSGDVIVMPDGKVYRALGRVLARVSGVSDDYKMPFSENLSHTIIGNGIPTQLTEHVIAPLLQNILRPTTPDEGNTKFSLRGSTPYGKQMEEWMEKNHLEKGAVPMEKPIMKEGENIFDYANRMVEWTRNQNLWKTAPKQTGFQDALDKWKADNGLSPDAYPPVRPHRENYSTEIGYAEDLEEYNKKKELWKSAPKPKDFDLSVDLEDMNKQLRNIRRAVLNQKNYDQRTVKAVSDLVRKMLNIGWGDGLSRGKVGNLLSAAKNATGANDVKKYLDKAMGILAENYLNRLSTAYDNLINTKGARADQSGVIKMGSLDAKGQAFMSEYKKAINMDDSSLNTYIANIEEDSAKNEDNVEMNDYRLAGIQAAIMYKQQIGGNDADIAELKRQIGELKNKKDATKEDKDLLKSLEKKLFENKFDRITMYENLLNNIQRMVKESKGRAKEFREEIAEHKNEILHRANLDLEGVDSAYYDTTTAKKKFVNNPILRFVMSSTYTFEQFLKFFGRHHANGEGYLYNYFMSEWQDAADEQQLYNEMNRNALDEKTKELFGKKNFIKLVGIDGKGMKEMDVEVTDYSNKETGKRTIHLKQGQMLYIYLVNKETDGEMKLRAMGITEEKVAEIEENLDPRVKAMGEWLQDEYLPECQRRYQATHTKYFGAPMKEVENYFPLAINNRARNIREDLNQDTDAISRLAGTSTGAIITRRVNVIPLDIENADAFAVAYNHLDEMEEWSAYLPFIQDVNTLLSSTHFRNQVMNMSSAAYGSGKTLWEEFKKVAQIAAGTYKPKVDNGMMDSKIAAVVGGIATAKISGRLWTAFKQTQSATTFLTECDPARFLWYGVNPYGSWHWAYDNLPLFRKRVEQLTAGDVKVRQFLDELEKYHDWTKTIAKVGMSPNILVDSVTCAVGARSVYETELNKLTKLGYSKDKAEEKAIQKASLSYNKTQQSSEGAFLSPMQVDRTYVSAALSLYKNANYAYGRKKIEAIRGIAKTYRFWGEHKNAMIGSMTRQIMDEDGLDENVANAIAKRAYTRTFWYNIGTLLNYMTIVPISWAAYKVLLYLLNGDDDDKKKKMIEEACLKGFATTTFDDYVIPFASNVLNAGLNIEDGKIGFDTDVFKYQNLYINPATSDLSNIYSMIGNQKWWSAGNKFGMLGIQMLVGFNPETIGALYQAYDEFDKDSGNMPLEIKLAVLKSISAPEESIRGLYMDELGLDNEDRTKVPLSVLEQRYAERQINRDNLLSQIAMPKETFDGYVEKYKKSFEKKIQDKMDKMDAYDQRKFDAIFDTTTDPALKGMMEKKRTKDANAAADEQIAKEGLNQEKKGKEPSEEAYDAVKMSIDVAEDNAISTYNKVLNKRYAALNDEYNNQTDAMKYIFMSKHPNFKSYKDLESEYTTYGKKMKELKEKLVSADGYDAKQTILKQIRVEREKFSELQSKVR